MVQVRIEVVQIEGLRPVLGWLVAVPLLGTNRLRSNGSSILLSISITWHLHLLSGYCVFLKITCISPSMSASPFLVKTTPALPQCAWNSRPRLWLTRLIGSGWTGNLTLMTHDFLQSISARKARYTICDQFVLLIADIGIGQHTAHLSRSRPKSEVSWTADIAKLVVETPTQADCVISAWKRLVFIAITPHLPPHLVPRFPFQGCLQTLPWTEITTPL